MSEELPETELINSPIVGAAAWTCSMLLVFGTSSRLSFLLTDLWCTQAFQISAWNFFFRPIPSTTVLMMFGILVVIHFFAQFALYGKQFVSILIRSLALIPAIILVLFILQLFTSTCGVERQFLIHYGEAFIIVGCLVASATLTAFAFYILPREVGFSTRAGPLMTSTFLIANAGTLLALIQLGAVVFVRGLK